MAQGPLTRLGTLLTRAQCEELRALYADPARFRKRVDMERHRFGRGEYQYFAYPLPEIVAELRETLYAQLAPAANEWMTALRFDVAFPSTLHELLEHCHAHGQTKPTPLMLKYEQGDYNCLHQDIYGDIVFPFQVIIALSRPEEEYTGGELLLVEQRPRAQSIGHAIRLAQGEAVAITTRYLPVPSVRGYSRAAVRHGVSELLSGERYTLGIIFHDAA